MITTLQRRITIPIRVRYTIDNPGRVTETVVCRDSMWSITPVGAIGAITFVTDEQVDSGDHTIATLAARRTVKPPS